MKTLIRRKEKGEGRKFVRKRFCELAKRNLNSNNPGRKSGRERRKEKGVKIYE
jgi:hypothetical protein